MSSNLKVDLVSLVVWRYGFAANDVGWTQKISSYIIAELIQPLKHSHLMTKTSATKYKTSEARSSQSSIPYFTPVMRFEVNRRPTARTARIVNATPVPMMAGPLILRPWIVSIAVRTKCSHSQRSPQEGEYQSYWTYIIDTSIWGWLQLDNAAP